jgi:hypothetical protein
MIHFDPRDPFPLINDYSYAEAKEHAIQVDQFLGFNCREIELQISQKIKTKENQEMWVGLDIQSLQTPYLEFRSLLQTMNLQAGESVIDLGCAYARLAHVMKAHYPASKYLGYEIIPERVSEAQRVLGKSFLQQVLALDLSQHSPPPAEVYFLYDYGSNQAIAKTLNDLLEISKTKKIKVAARGRASRFLIHRDHPWLCEVEDPLHFQNYSIYQS